MPTEYDRWLDEVRDALRSINMPMDEWQGIWPFDFKREHDGGTSPDYAAAKANRFWWYQQNRSMGRECDKIPACWLPSGHQGECQPQYEAGDYIKVEFEGESAMPGEWMWVIVQNRDDKSRIVYGIGVIGGPPCQAFSMSNVHKKSDDPRLKLPGNYAHILSELNKHYGLDFFVFENVLGLRHKARLRNVWIFQTAL